MPLINREKLCVNHEKIGTKNPPFFHHQFFTVSVLLSHVPLEHDVVRVRTFLCTRFASLQFKSPHVLTTSHWRSEFYSQSVRISHLVAPYCTIPRDYTPSLFSERFPLGEHAKWRCDTPPHTKGYLSDTCAIPHENKANGCDTPPCDIVSKRYCAIWGGYLALGR